MLMIYRSPYPKEHKFSFCKGSIIIVYELDFQINIRIGMYESLLIVFYIFMKGNWNPL